MSTRLHYETVTIPIITAPIKRTLLVLAAHTMWESQKMKI